jgi:transposase
VPALNAAPQEQLQQGLRSANAFTLRRCQILLASAQGASPSQIAHSLGCTGATVRNASHAFRREGLHCLQEKSSRPRSVRPFLDATFAGPLKDRWPRSPRTFGQPTSRWTLDRVAAVCHAQGGTPRPLSGEAIRLALKRLGIRWRRAQHWITSPDPAYARKKKRATG